MRFTHINIVLSEYCEVNMKRHSHNQHKSPETLKFEQKINNAGAAQKGLQSLPGRCDGRRGGREKHRCRHVSTKEGGHHRPHLLIRIPAQRSSSVVFESEVSVTPARFVFPVFRSDNYCFLFITLWSIYWII